MINKKIRKDIFDIWTSRISNIITICLFLLRFIPPLNRVFSNLLVNQSFTTKFMIATMSICAGSFTLNKLAFQNNKAIIAIIAGLLTISINLMFIESIFTINKLYIYILLVLCDYCGYQIAYYQSNKVNFYEMVHAYRWLGALAFIFITQYL